MNRSQYSPTVVAAYKRDPEWFNKIVTKLKTKRGKVPIYDDQGYDMYGYNARGSDRDARMYYDYDDDIDAVLNTKEGKKFDDVDKAAIMHMQHRSNQRYEQALAEWGFDGTRPKWKKHKTSASYELTPYVPPTEQPTFWQGVGVILRYVFGKGH